MPGPTLSLSETLALESAIETIAAAQAALAAPVQVRTDDGAAIQSLGVPEAMVTAAAAQGFAFAVDELSNDSGPIGWRLRVDLDRDGLWSFVHEVIGGVVTVSEWRSAPEGPPWP